MYLRELYIAGFRNIRELKLQPAEGVSIFLGRNAQGKTNLLEAIYTCAYGTSFRAGRDSELIGWGCPRALVQCRVERRDVTRRISVVIDQAQGKSIQINGKSLRRHADLLGHLNVVLFTPDDLELVKGSPGRRRRFLDTELSQVSPFYRQALNSYTRVLNQRNVLLKKSERLQVDILEGFNYQLVAVGAKVMAQRSEAVRKLSLLAKLAHRRVTGGHENLEIIYKPFFLEADEAILFQQAVQAGERSPWSEEMLRRFFEEDLAQKQQEEKLRQVTLVGPQRDDILFFINGRDARTYGSQGQQRTAVLSCKMAELEFIRSETGEYPLLLLDDVMSELDAARRTALLDLLTGRVQVLLTTTTLAYFPKEALDDAKVTEIKEGQISPLKTAAES